jgi:hypothetical protein
MAPDAAMTTPLKGRWSFAIRRYRYQVWPYGFSPIVLRRSRFGEFATRVCVVLCCAAGVFAARGERRNTAQNGRPSPRHEQGAPRRGTFCVGPSPAWLRRILVGW